MGKQWIVVDTNVFCRAGYQEAGGEGVRERDYLHEGGEACEFLDRMVKYCDEYGLAVDTDGLLVEEYDQQIIRGSFGYYAFRRLAVEIPGKTRSFSPKNPDWVDQLEGGSKLDKHDRRFLATALATPDKVLVSQDMAFLENASFLRGKGIQVHDVGEANATL